MPATKLSLFEWLVGTGIYGHTPVGHGDPVMPDPSWISYSYDLFVFLLTRCRTQELVDEVRMVAAASHFFPFAKGWFFKLSMDEIIVQLYT